MKLRKHRMKTWEDAEFLLFQNICYSPFFWVCASYSFPSSRGVSGWNRSKIHRSASQKVVFKLPNTDVYTNVDIFTCIFHAQNWHVEQYQSKTGGGCLEGPLKKWIYSKLYFTLVVLNNWFMFQVNFYSNLRFYFFNYPFFPYWDLIHFHLFLQNLFSCSQYHYAFPGYFVEIKCLVLYLFIINYQCLFGLCFVSCCVIFLFPIFYTQFRFFFFPLTTCSE